MKRTLIIILALCLGTVLAAQNRITGTVVDADSYPVIGAGVMIKGTSKGAVTDGDGKFSLEAVKGDVVTVSSLGYVSYSFTVSDKTVYDVVLQVDSEFLDEVVVVGYDTQKKVNLTGSVSSVPSERISERATASVTSALQGLAAGVTVTSQSGNPGASNSSIRIRGIGTFGGSNSSPLILIDGVQGDIDDVDPSQIDKMSILKDAASSSIYGSRAANGVILITTKRAQKDKFSLTYRGYTGWSSPTDIPSLVDAVDYMKLSREASLNDGDASIYSEEFIAGYLENHRYDPDSYPITKWQDKILNGSGFSQNHTLAFNAATGKMRNSASFGYLDQDGIIKRQDYKRYNFRDNMTISVFENLSVNFDAAVNYGHRDAVPLAATLFNMMNTRDPLILTQWSNGDYAPMTGGSVNILPVTDGQGGEKKVGRLRFNGSASVNWAPFEWLTLEGKIAPRLNVSHTHQFDDVISYSSDAYGTKSPVTSRLYNELSEAQSQNFYMTYQATAVFHKNLASAHDVKMLLGVSRETMDQKYYFASRQSLPYPDYPVLRVGAEDETMSNDGTRSQWALQSYFGRVNYNFKERYLFEANVRFDGSSRFATGHQWGVFPSFSGAWRMSEEPWMNEVKHILTEMKIRASYGTLGNQNISSSNYPFAELLNMDIYSVNDVLVPAAYRSSLANEGITWETSEMTDIGVDLSLWNKFTVTADWYLKNTHGILMTLNIPLSTGLGAPYRNAGEVRNVGWEIAAGYHDSWGDFRFGFDANVSDVVNTITEMDGQYESKSGGIIRNQEGSSINSIYGLKCLGMARNQDQADWINMNLRQYGSDIKPGDLIYADTNGDGVVTDADMTVIGSAIPRFTYGMTLNLGWKGLNVSAFFQGVGKADAYLSSYYVQPCINGGTFRTEHLDRWTPDTPDGKYPRMTYKSEQNRKQSSFWMRDASYLRLKNLNVSYTFPSKWFRHISGLTVFGCAENLFTVTDFYQGYDPEVCYDSNGSNGVSMGAVADNYPQVKTYTFGLELKF